MNPDMHADYRRQAEQHFGGAAPNREPATPRTVSPTSAPSAYEHRNIALLPGEEPLYAADFTPSPILRHIKTGLVVTADRVAVRYPQYMFFVIRVGHAESSAPIRQVCSVTTGRQLSQRRVMYAGVAGLFGFFMLMSSLSAMGFGFMGPLMLLFSLALLAFAAFQAWMARGLALIVAHGGGGTLRVDLDKAEYQDMLTADGLIQQLMVNASRAASIEAPSAPPVPAAVQTSAPPQPRPVAQPSPSNQRPTAPPSIWRG